MDEEKSTQSSSLSSSSLSELNATPSSFPHALEKTQTAISGMESGLPLWRRYLVVFVLSWVTLNATFSSTSLLSVASEISLDLHTTPEAVNLSTGGLLLAMGLSSFIWSPVQSIFGRQLAYNSCIAVLFFLTCGAALARDMPTFVAMRVLLGFTGTYFHVSGQTILAEYFPPVQRGTATGLFLCGTVLGPPLGPCIAGIVVTFTSWRVILWLQVAMVGIGFILSIIFVPPAKTDLGFARPNMCWKPALAQFNPLPVFKVMTYPNVALSDISCGLLSWSQYFLLAAPRQILSSQFHLTSPLTSGLFYIAPSVGFLLGTVIGGRHSDKIVRRWIVKRGGVRLPQDRLNSGQFLFFLVIPTASLVYGWGLECIEFSKLPGGLAFPMVFAFVIAAGQLAAFACLNTYCAEALPKKRREVIASKYVVQYMFGACASSATGPLISAIRIGPACSIAAMAVFTAGILVFLTARHGLSMQTWAERRAVSGSKT